MAITKETADHLIRSAAAGSAADMEKLLRALVAGDFVYVGGTEVTATAAEINKLDGAGAVVASGTQEANITDASTAHALNATFSDTEVEAALNALGTKINSVIAALEAFGITASA
jgi:hypothetical protein